MNEIITWIITTCWFGVGDWQARGGTGLWLWPGGLKGSPLVQVDELVPPNGVWNIAKTINKKQIIPYKIVTSKARRVNIQIMDKWYQ